MEQVDHVSEACVVCGCGLGKSQREVYLTELLRQRRHKFWVCGVTCSYSAMRGESRTMLSKIVEATP